MKFVKNALKNAENVKQNVKRLRLSLIPQFEKVQGVEKYPQDYFSLCYNLTIFDSWAGKFIPVKTMI